MIKCSLYDTQAGKVYSFLLTAADAEDAAVAATARTSVAVQGSPTSVQLLGGTTRTVSAADQIPLLARLYSVSVSASINRVVMGC